MSLEEHNLSLPVEENEQTEEDINVLKKVRIEKFEALKNDGKNPYEITKFDVSALNAQLREAFEKREAAIIADAAGNQEAIDAGLEEIKDETVSIAGRIMSWRDMGKANFIDVRDTSDRMQIYVRMNDIGEELFRDFKTWDIGDIVGVEGFVFRTKKGEISIHA